LIDVSAYKMGKIRIVYILCAEERGGVEEHVLSLVRNIDRNRFLPFVVAPPKLIDLFGKDLTDTETTVMPLNLYDLFDIAGRLNFISFLRKNRIHIVNTHMFIASITFSPLARLAGVPVLIETSHGVEKWRLEKGLIKRNSFVIDRFISILQTKILAVSHACCNDLVKIKRIPRKKIVVVRNGRDLSNFIPLSPARRKNLRALYGLSDYTYVFGVMARLDFQKGHVYLFDAICKLLKKRKDFKLLVIGDGAQKEELKRKVLELGIDSHVIFTGFQKDLPGYHGILDVHVLPSLFEGLPLGLIEASAMERPVIATDVDGSPEVIVKNETGILVPPRNAEKLAEAMEYALDNKDEMKFMGIKGRKFALKYFTLERQVFESENLYSSLLAECYRK
jgi:glycosyltransferase involved in cell wall biosynthesis